MIHVPILRWGQPYESLDKDPVVHFDTGEKVAEVSRAVPGMVRRDLRQAHKAREALRAIPSTELIKMMQQAGQLFMSAELPLGDSSQTPEDFAKQQSATTGLPEHMARKNMDKVAFVLGQMDRIIDALTRGLDLSILSQGHGVDAQ